MTDYDRLLGEILDRGPSSETLGVVLAELKRLGHTRRVIQECLRALRHHPDDLPLRLILAEAYVEEGLFSHAEAELESAVSQMDRYASAYWLQAEVYRAQKRNEEALRSLKTYLALRPSDDRALDLLNELDIPQPAPALDLAPAEQQTPEPPRVEAPEALPPAAAESFLEAEPEKPEFRFEDEALSEIATPTLAEVYVHQGQIQEAISIYEKVMAQHPEDQASLIRIEELRAMLEAVPPLRETAPLEPEAEAPAPEPGLYLPEDAVPKSKQRKEKTIAILESWLANIRKMSEDTLSA